MSIFANMKKNIQMVDVVGQYKHIQDEINNAILKILNKGDFINGAIVKEFAHNLASFLNVNHVIPCANGTDAIQVALMSLDLKAGDEVITTPFTFVATAEVIALLGLKPIFVDINLKTFNLDAHQIEAAITDKTKCIIPVHLFGQGAEMEKIMSIAEKHNLYVIEDNAQAIGAEYHFSNNTSKKLGTIGHIGTTSFYPSKNLGAYGDAGAIFTNDDEIAFKIKEIVNHGSSNKYHYSRVGVNSRLDSIQAAILNIKLKHLENYNLARQKVAQFYNNELKNNPYISIPQISNFSTHVYHQYTLLVNDRDNLQKHLKEKDIPSGIYYPIPLHLHQPYLTSNLSLKNSEKAAKSVLSLPIHTEMNKEELKFICNSINKFYK